MPDHEYVKLFGLAGDGGNHRANRDVLPRAGVTDRVPALPSAAVGLPAGVDATGVAKQPAPPFTRLTDEDSKVTEHEW